MKTSTLLLLASLVGNGALVAALVLKSPLPQPAPSAIGPAVLPASATPGRIAAVSIPVANLWSRLMSNDYDEFNRRLRAAGFPAKAVRALLGMAINEEQSAREEAIRGKREDIPYWKYAYQMLDRDQQTQLYEGIRETRELFYKFVNGPDALADSEEDLVAAQRRFGKLPLDKLQKLTAMQHDFDELRMQAYSVEAPRDEAARRARIEAVNAQERTYHEAVGQLLTPDELEQYELRNDAGGLRMQLASFRPTEEEFKTLYAIQKQAGSVANREQYLALAQAALSPERYAEYVLTQTSSDATGKLGQLISRLELPLTTITAVNAVRDDINARAKIIGADPALTADQRSAQLAALAQEANEKLTSTLGQRGYAAYSDMKGDWIRALKPKSK